MSRAELAPPSVGRSLLRAVEALLAISILLVVPFLFSSLLVGTDGPTAAVTAVPSLLFAAGAGILLSVLVLVRLGYGVVKKR